MKDKAWLCWQWSAQ